jgi:branched-chain amino acid aminotransferase
MPKVFINGRFCEEGEARVSVYDHGFLYGDGIFETLRVYGGRIFRLEAHLARLRASAGKIALPLPWDDDGLRETLRECLKVNSCDEAVLRLTVSRGAGPPGLDPALCPTPTLVVLTRPFNGYPETMYREGVSAALVSVRKPPADVLDPGIKSANYLNNILAKIEAKQVGADEAILLNGDGFLAEGSVSNLFFVKDQTLFTPSPAAGILNGITRQVVLEIARAEGIPVEEDLLRPATLRSADEAFLTNTTYEVMPVRRVDERRYSIGPHARRIHDTFRRHIHSA